MTTPASRIERPECEPPPTGTSRCRPGSRRMLSKRHAEPFGDELREAGLVALAGRQRADHDVDRAFRLHRDFGRSRGAPLVISM